MGLRRKRQIAAKVEAVEGTVETLTASEAGILIEEPSVAVDVSRFERKPALAKLSTLQGIAGISTKRFTFRTEFKGAGDTVTTPPEIKPLLLACGFQEETLRTVPISGGSGTFQHAETVNGAPSGGSGTVFKDQAATGSALRYVAGGTDFSSGDTLTGATSGATATAGVPADAGLRYRPDSDASPSITIASMEDGVQKRARGARGTLVINAVVGEPVHFDFDIFGVYNNISDVALFSGVTFDTPRPPVFQSAGLIFQAYSAVVAANFSFNMNNELAPRQDANSADGILSVKIPDRTPNGSIDPEMVLVATKDFFGDMKGDVTGAIEFVLGSTLGNIVEFFAPVTQSESIGDADRDLIDTLDLSFGVHKSGVNTTGDDEVFLVFR